MSQLPVHDPATGELIVDVDLANTADCLAAVDHAADALPRWRGRVRAGGQAPDRSGAFYLPTVIDRIDQQADILHREIFGPVAPVSTFVDDSEVIELANDSSVGLMAYVMTGDLQRGLRLAEAIETGMVSLNRGLISDPAAPFGGMKASGLGREGGFEGIEEYLERQYVGVSW